MKKFRCFWPLLTFLLMPAAFAAGPAEVRKQIESSMLVTGEVEITEEGTVSKLQIDQPEKLPAGVVNLVRGQVSQWNFEPVRRNGKGVPARSPMSVRVVGRRTDKDTVTISIRNAVFPGPLPGKGEAVSKVSMLPPSYPGPAARAGIEATTYLVLKIERDGSVGDAIVEQVNLRTVASEKNMTMMRGLFAEASLKAARKWTYHPPTVGEAAAEDHWSVRVPVEYTFDEGGRGSGYGKWYAYVPGPRQAIPWDEEAGDRLVSPDALAEGGVYMAGSDQALRLLTVLDEG